MQTGTTSSDLPGLLYHCDAVAPMREDHCRCDSPGTSSNHHYMSVSVLE